jgi:hypothetical protein
MYATDTDTRIELLPGVYRRLVDCCEDDLALAAECEAARRQLHTEAGLLIAEAAHHGIDIPEDLRERLAVFSGSLVDIVGLVDELRDAVRLVPV